jgi:hypothetical protein
MDSERGGFHCTGPNKSFDCTRSEEERNLALFDVNSSSSHVVGFGEATKEKMKDEGQEAKEKTPDWNFYMRNYLKLYRAIS